MLVTKIYDKIERYDYSILEVCETLHMAKTGSYCDLKYDESILLRAFLVTRIMDWGSPTSPYDRAVWNLMTAVLEEYA